MPDYTRPIVESWVRPGIRVTTYKDNLDPHQETIKDGVVTYTDLKGNPWTPPAPPEQAVMPWTSEHQLEDPEATTVPVEAHEKSHAE
jgi:hypothetical protein